MKEIELTDLLKETGVIMEGHFLLTSGRHSDRFLQCSQLLQYPHYAGLVCRLMAEPFQNEGIDTVIGPAMGGVILSFEVARALGARSIFAEPVDDKMVLRRGFRLKPKERVLVVEDTVTTGGSVNKVLELLQSMEVDVVGIAIMIDRTAGRIDFGFPARSLLSMAVESYDPADCPLCREGIPLHKPKG